MAVDFDRIQKINKLAKALMESKMAKSNDEAMKMAEEMVDKGEQQIADLMKKETEDEKE